MVMKNEDIIDGLNRLEMRAGCHELPEPLRLAIIDALQPKKPVKRSPGGRKLNDDEVAQEEFKTKVKGRQPE